MKIRLLAVDSKIPNLALMKISAYHKAKGDDVRLYDPLFCKPDKIYASKVFDFTPDYFYYPKGIEIDKGGSGYDLKKKLPDYIENMYPDYSIFNCKYAMGFTTRGCIRKCPYCIVRKKEGYIKTVGDIYNFWNEQEHLMLLDNNLTAIPIQFEKICRQLIKEKIKTDFNQGLDLRLITKEMTILLSKVKLWKQIHFAWDNINDEVAIRKGLKTLVDNGVKSYKIMVYVLIGFNSNEKEDLYRVMELKKLGVDPFVMPFDKKNNYQKDFARWCNRKWLFKSVKWEHYKKSNKKYYNYINKGDMK